MPLEYWIVAQSVNSVFEKNLIVNTGYEIFAPLAPYNACNVFYRVGVAGGLIVRDNRYIGGHLASFGNHNASQCVDYQYLNQFITTYGEQILYNIYQKIALYVPSEEDLEQDGYKYVSGITATTDGTGYETWELEYSYAETLDEAVNAFIRFVKEFTGDTSASIRVVDKDILDSIIYSNL